MKTPSATIRNVLSPPRACGLGINQRRTPAKNEERGHCSGLLTVDYSTTSPGGIPAPSGSMPHRRSATSVGGPLTREPNFCGVHSLCPYGDIGWQLAPRGAKKRRGCVGYWLTAADDGGGRSKDLYPRLRDGRAPRQCLHPRRRLGRGAVRPRALTYRGRLRRRMSGPSLMSGPSERAGRFCRERRDEQSENIPKINHPNAPTTFRRLLR